MIKIKQPWLWIVTEECTNNSHGLNLIEKQDQSTAVAGTRSVTSTYQNNELVCIYATLTLMFFLETTNVCRYYCYNLITNYCGTQFCDNSKREDFKYIYGDQPFPSLQLTSAWNTSLHICDRVSAYFIKVFII